MKIKKIRVILLIFCLVVLAGITRTYAASVTFSVPDSITIGETITAKISGTSEQWNLELKADGNSVVKSNNLTNEGSEIAINASGTYKPTKTGTITFKLTGDYSYTSGNDVKTQEVNITKNVTVVDKKDIPTTTPTPSDTVSSDSTLTNLGINPYDFSDFSKEKFTYSVTVPKEVSTINIYANKRAGQTVTGIGNKTLKIGDNAFKVVVTAEDKKTTNTYTINIKRESISKVATLKNLGITPNDFNGFKSTTYSYKVNVPNDVEKINIYAEKTNAGSTVTGTGNKTLEVGLNTFKVVVTAEDKKTTRTYTLAINRLAEKNKTEDTEKEEPEDNKEDETKDTDAIGLIGLEIAGYTLSPEFRNDVYEYKTEITDEVEKLDIKTKTSSNKIETEIIGNENFKIGENLITILVKNEDGTKTTYQITADAVQTPVDVSNLNNEINDAQNKMEKQKIIVIVVIGIVLTFIVLFFVEMFKIKKRENEEYYDEEDDDDEDDNNYENNTVNLEENEIIEDKHDILEEDDEKFNKILEDRGFDIDTDFDESRQRKWNAKGKRYK